MAPSIWVRPDTGAVLRTEIGFEIALEDGRYTARMRVTYQENRTMGMLVPDHMEEAYDSKFHSVEARADYVNFMRFGVEVSIGHDTTAR